MNLLRIVTSMAWSDGHLASEEIDLMLDRFSGMFAADAPQQQRLRQELQEYMTQNIPLEELTPKLQSVEERELVLRLGYEVIRSSARTLTEEKINEEEAAAYTRLVQLLNLPVETVQQVESEVSTQPSSEGIVDSLTRKLEKFMQG
jgi:hypothetical protein